MHATQVLMVGLGAFAVQALAGGLETIIDTTVVTITSCGPEVTSCPGSLAPTAPTTEEVTETSTYCPPTIATPVIPATSPSAPAVPTSSTVVPVVIPDTSVTIQVSSVPTPVGSATPDTPASVVPVVTPVASYPLPIVSSSTPIVPIVVGNSTLTVSTLPKSEASILVATGSPSVSTSVSVVPATHTGATTTASVTPTHTGSAGHVAVPAFMLGFVAFCASLMG